MVDKQIVKLFQQFQKETGKYDDFEIDKLDFDNVDLFNEGNVVLRGALKLETHDILEKINDENGIPVFDASINILTYIDEKKYRNCVFENKNNSNPDLSFANEGNSSAGTNFIFHTYKYFVNNHRTVIDFSGSECFSKYVYYSIKNMKEEYGFKRGHVPSQARLKELGIIIPIPKQLNKTYTSFRIQEILVEFIEYFSNYNDSKLKVIDEKITPKINEIESLILPLFFAKEERMCRRFNTFAAKEGFDVKLEDVEFNSIGILNIVKFVNGSEFPKSYVKRSGIKGEIPLISAGTKNDIMGNIKTLVGNNPLHIDKHYVYNDTKEKWNEVKHYINNDYYTLTADGIGGTLIPRLKKDYLNGFYTTNVCKVVDFLSDKETNKKFFYYSYNFGRVNLNFDFGHKANNENLSKININIPKPYKSYTSYELQEIFVKFIEEYFQHVEKMRGLSNVLINKYKEHTETIIARTFLNK